MRKCLQSGIVATAIVNSVNSFSTKWVYTPLMDENFNILEFSRETLEVLTS